MMSSEQIPEGACLVCRSPDVVMFLEMAGVPIHCNVLWPTRAEARRAPRGDIRLGFCSNCGHIFNLTFDPERTAYSQAYENSLHFSPRFQDYARSLAVRLIEAYDLRGKDIIEIGSGKGEFLTLLCELGDNRGVGFDPSYVPEGATQLAAGRTMFIQDFYSERYAGYQADLFCCRHVLEHMQDPVDVLTMLRRTIGNRPETIVFFEVPNMLFTLRDLAIWDIIYEHCSYFSRASLARAFTLSGFDVVCLGEAFGAQFLYIEASPGGGEVDSGGDSQKDLEEVARDVAAFADRYRSKSRAWQRDLEQIAEREKRAVVWGAGSKGVTFLNVLQASDQIEYVVDINPRKHGMFVAGAGQRIVPPEFLRDHQPDVVIVMNSIYENEIRQITDSLGLAVDFVNA
jgi:2-polyprenyl-3-methyl-5-hydroxy-6-metoxy-1,4-benzoquinol methylase